MRDATSILMENDVYQMSELTREYEGLNCDTTGRISLVKICIASSGPSNGVAIIILNNRNENLNEMTIIILIRKHAGGIHLPCPIGIHPSSTSSSSHLQRICCI